MNQEQPIATTDEFFNDIGQKQTCRRVPDMLLVDR
jgi:hypothetical protein